MIKKGKCRLNYGIFIVACFILFGCSNNIQEISTNMYKQTNFPRERCYIKGTTWSKTILCLDDALQKEHIQNDLTNKMLLEKKSETK